MVLDEMTFFGLAYASFVVALVAYLAHALKGDEVYAPVASGVAWLGAVLLLAGLALRLGRTGHWPVVGRYQVSLTFALAVVVAYLLLERLTGLRAAGVFVLFVALAFLSYALFIVPSPERMAPPLPPVLRSGWFATHFSATAAAYSLFALSCSVSLLHLIRPVLAGRGWGRSLPDGEAAEGVNYRVVMLGFAALTVGVVAGAVWAWLGWGGLWPPHAAGAGVLAVWLIYGAWLHVRWGGWSGRRLAVVSVVGFCVVLFALLGTGWPVAGYNALGI